MHMVKKNRKGRTLRLHQKLLDKQIESAKQQATKIIHKKSAFLYTNNELQEK